MRRIRLLHWLNVAIWGAIVALAVAYGPELGWAARSLPRYLDGEIGAPIERTLYREAKRILRSGEDIERARPLLERSLAIDPTCEAGFWLAEYHFARGEHEEAAQRFARYIEIDPTRVDAYLKGAEALTELGRADDARRLLEAGLAYFEGSWADFIPKPLPNADRRFNKKALRTHERYERSARELRLALGLPVEDDEDD